MADDKYNYTKGSEFSALGPLRRSFDITPSTNNLPQETRAIMVTEDATVTGELVGDDEGDTHTTATLSAGVLYPFMFRKITAVSTGSVKGYS